MNSAIYYIKGLFQQQEADGFMVFWAREILGSLLIIALFWMLNHLAVSVLSKWMKKLASFTATDLDDRIVQRIIPYISRLLMTLGVYLALRSLPLNEKLVVIVSGAVFVVLVFLVCNLIYNLLDELMKWYVSRHHDSAVSMMSQQMVPIAEKMVSLFLIGTGLIIILKHFNYDIFSLVTALGIGSLAIGMAAKDTLAHMISGFTLMLDRPFRIGDRIQLSGGQTGDVADIGLRSTKIRTLDNQLLIIPNSDLCNTMLTNLAFPDQRVKGRINVGVAYGSDMELVKASLVETALGTEGVLQEPAPEALFLTFGDYALNMSLFFWVEQYGDLFAVTDRVNTNIIRHFRDSGIEIPCPIRTVRLIPEKPVS